MMMPNMSLSLLILAVFVCGNVHSIPTSNPACLDALAPPTNSRGVNRLSRFSHAPLFKLEVSPAAPANESDHEGSMTYKVLVNLENELLDFSDAKISVESLGPCGSGSLTFDPQHFLEAKQKDPECPRLLLTNRKVPMTKLPNLYWTPPSCGCVEFRVIVIEGGNIYYADDRETDNGPLSQTVCVHKKATREQHLDALCHVRERYSAAEILSRSSFLLRHQLESRWMDRHGLEMALELRRSDNRLCCSQKTLDAKMTCFDDTRRRRVDRFCEDGYPDIPFTSFRLTQMREVEKKCCFILGEHRYSCFAKDSELINGDTVNVLDYSQDETDPVNDLAEFATLKDKDILQRIRTITFGKNNAEESDSEEDDEEDGQDIEGEKGDKDDEDEEKSQTEAAPKHSFKNSLTTEKVGNKNTNYPKEHLNVESPNVPDTAADSVTQQVHQETEGKGIQDGVDVKEASHVVASVKKSADTVRESPKAAASSGAKQNQRPTPTLTSAERRRPLRKNGSSRKGRKWSGEVLGNRRTSREYMNAQRRVSAEWTARRRASAERQMGAVTQQRWLPGQEYPYYPDDYLTTGALPIIPTESPRLTSAQRRSRTRTSSQRRRQIWTGVAGEPNFDDEGGVSVDETLDKLEKKVQRLRLRRDCCEAGATAGIHVYGSFTNTWTECSHSGDKFILSMDILSGTKPCLEQFRKCCIEEAVTGPTMTSGEFRAAWYGNPTSMDRANPLKDLQQVERRIEGLDIPQKEAKKPGRKDISRKLPARETPEAYELESEKRFQSMRSVIDVPEDYEDEYNGPRHFDDADNNDKDIFDLMERKEEIGRRTRPRNNDEEEMSDFDDRTFVDGDDDDDDDKDDIEEEIINFDGRLSKSHTHRNGKTDLTDKEKEKNSDDKKQLVKQRENKEQDEVERDLHNSRTVETSQVTARSNTNKKSLAKTSGGRSRYARHSQERNQSNRSKGNRNRSRNSRRRSRNSRKRSSRRTSKERGHRTSTSYAYRDIYNHQPYGRLGALDSQEMADVHAKRMLGALDSKEMAAAYKERAYDGTGFQSDVYAGRTSKRRHFWRRTG